MSLITLALLAFIQGMAELLPVSSSAHVIFASHLLGFDPSTPEMTFLIVMLHTGTMFAVLLYFWNRWKPFLSKQNRGGFIKSLIIASLATLVVGGALKVLLEKILLPKILGIPVAEVEQIFKLYPMIAGALFAAGILIILSEKMFKLAQSKSAAINTKQSVWIGAVQGLCLPFRGFSRSGATISTGLWLGLSRTFCEDFSFALAVILTPPVIAKEWMRLLHHHDGIAISYGSLLAPGLIGMVLSFASGLLALRWLSSWLEKGRWSYFGYYCLIFSAVFFFVTKS